MLGIIKKILLGIAVVILIALCWIFFSSLCSNDKKSEGKETISPISELKTFTIEPTEKHSATVIFLHGLGDSANNWENNLRLIAKNYPNVKFIIPEAPRKFMSMNYGWPSSSWYNIQGSIKDIMNMKQNKEELLESVQQIEQIIQREIDSGMEPEKIMVGGFSQGGSVALALGLTTTHQLGGIICMSGFLPCREEIFGWAKENNQITFNFYHSYYDNLVPCEIGEKSAELVKEQGFSVEFKEKYKYRGHGHFWTLGVIKEIFGEELEKVLKAKGENEKKTDFESEFKKNFIIEQLDEIFIELFKKKDISPWEVLEFYRKKKWFCSPYEKETPPNEIVQRIEKIESKILSLFKNFIQEMDKETFSFCQLTKNKISELEEFFAVGEKLSQKLDSELDEEKYQRVKQKLQTEKEKYFK